MRPTYRLFAAFVLLPFVIIVSFYQKYQQARPQVQDTLGSAQFSVNSFVVKSDRNILNTTGKGSNPFSVISSTVKSDRNILNSTGKRFCGRIASKTGRFLWDVQNKEWFSVSNASATHYHNYTYGTIELERNLILALDRNHRNTYRRLGKIFVSGTSEELILWMDDKLNDRVATFRDVTVSSEGWIVQKGTCFAVKNGGCPTPSHWMNSTNVLFYDHLVSIAAYWTYGPWHFTMEALVALANIANTDLHSSFIHVTSKNQYVMQWMDILKIPSERVVSGSISTNILIVPEMGRCGSPSAKQLQWLRRNIYQLLHLPEKLKNIVLIKRTKKRVMRKFNEIEHLIQNISKNDKRQFILHNDNALPSLKVQLQYFANADIIIGPHGAGLVNAISAKPGTCIIEFLPMDINVCYMRMSYLLGHKYFGIQLRADNTIDINVLNKTVTRCLTYLLYR